jgi:hypothetical protein
VDQVISEILTAPGIESAGIFVWLKSSGSFPTYSPFVLQVEDQFRQINSQGIPLFITLDTKKLASRIDRAAGSVLEYNKKD